MKLVAVFPLLLCLMFCTHDVSSQWEEEQATTTRPITFLQAVLQSDIVQRKIAGAIDLIDLKLHHLRILKDLFTTENLITLRRTLEWMVSATNLVIRILPDNPEQPSVATILHQLLGLPVDEATDELDLPIEVDFDNGDNNSLQDPYPTEVHPPVFQTPIGGDSNHETSQTSQNPLDDVSINQRSVGGGSFNKSPAPVFENQLRFGGISSDDDEDLVGSADNEVLPSEKHNTVVVSPTSTSTSGFGVVKGQNEESDKRFQVVLKPEELSVLKSYGMDPQDALRLAQLLYETRNDRSGRATLEGEMHKVSDMYGDKSPQAMSLARLVRGPYN